MRIIYDEAKRSAVLAQRGLDMADAASLFDTFHLTRYDAKHSEGEDRYITVGTMQGEVVLLVWTQRDDDRRIITLWKANDREREYFHRERDRRG